MEKELKKNTTVDTISTCFGAGEPEARLPVEVSRSALKKHCFTLGISFNDLEDEYVLGTGSVLCEKVNLVLTNPSYSTRSARDKSSSGHDLLLK